MPVKVSLSVPYAVSRAFDVPYDKEARRIDVSGLSAFWQENEFHNWLGCYIFGARWGGRVTPWYVGRTGRTFEEEAFERHKLKHYNTVLEERPKCRPVMMFVYRESFKGRVEAIPYDYLETELIRMCAQVNQGLKNDKKMRQKVLLIRGVTDKTRGRKSSETLDFRNMLSLESN